jgi:5-formyltetrahydrofolate cyclo-ligase
VGTENKDRWKGRNVNKDALRDRVWNQLETSGIGVGTIRDSIPNFQGAEQAAARLAEMPFWKSAKVIKSNPDAPQIPVRLRALQDGKILYMPVPELALEFPFLELDPQELLTKGVSFEEAATIRGAMEHGRRVQFTEMRPMDVLVVGSVAATCAGGRTGKGAGFADLELGIFREVGTIAPNAVLLTTVHDIQVVDDDELPMQEHDSPLDWVITPTRAIQTNTKYSPPKGLVWEAIQPDQYRDIPFLSELAKKLRTQ